MSDCQWLVFDAVGTLIDPNPSVAMAYHTLGTQFGSQLTVHEVGQRFRSAFRRSEQDGFPGGPPISQPWKTSDEIEQSRWRWIVREVLPDVRDHEGCFRALWDHFAIPASWKCFDDVERSLPQLSDSGYQLAISTNFDDRLHSVLDVSSYLTSIKHRVISATVGFRKPSAEFYAAVIQECGCPAEQILMVGDNFEYDVRAARQSGLQALHLDRDSGHAAGEADESPPLRSLTDLVRRLRNRNGIARPIRPTTPDIG